MLTSADWLSVAMRVKFVLWADSYSSLLVQEVLFSSKGEKDL